MEDTIVSFEVAKLLKDKKFEQNMFPYYSKDLEYGNIELHNNYKDFYPEEGYEICVSPTLSLVQKWLREVHNIHIVISVNFYKDGINYLWQVFKYDLEKKYYCTGTACYGDKGEYSTYELALEQGILEALKLIK